MRTLIWIGGGVLLGIVIHLAIILSLPTFATQDVWTRVARLGEERQIVLLDQVQRGDSNPFGLDPKLVYAICRLDLSKGPGVISGTLPKTFWSVSVFNRSGHSIYSTTNRSGIGQILDMGIFNTSQTRLLAQQKITIDEGLLIVESKQDDVFVVIRTAPEHDVLKDRYREALAKLRCRNLSIQ